MSRRGRGFDGSRAEQHAGPGLEREAREPIVIARVVDERADIHRHHAGGRVQDHELTVDPGRARRGIERSGRRRGDSGGDVVGIQRPNGLILGARNLKTHEENGKSQNDDDKERAPDRSVGMHGQVPFRAGRELRSLRHQWPRAAARFSGVASVASTPR